MLQLGRSHGTGSNTINNINLPMCHKTRDLDILIDSEINVKKHIYNITASANQRAFLVKKCFPSKDTSSLVKAFEVYVRPLVEYYSPVRAPSNTDVINKLESVQRRFTKVCRACLHFLILNVCVY